MAGGQSWTKNWLTFDNSYFSAKPTSDRLLLRLPTDEALYTARPGPPDTPRTPPRTPYCGG